MIEEGAICATAYQRLEGKRSNKLTVYAKAPGLPGEWPSCFAPRERSPSKTATFPDNPSTRCRSCRLATREPGYRAGRWDPSPSASDPPPAPGEAVSSHPAAGGGSDADGLGSQ